LQFSHLAVFLSSFSFPEVTVAIQKSRAACAQSFALWQQATTEIMRRNLSYYCLLAPRIYLFVLRAHPVRGESHNQCNTTGEVATTRYTMNRLINGKLRTEDA